MVGDGTLNCRSLIRCGRVDRHIPGQSQAKMGLAMFSAENSHSSWLAVSVRFCAAIGFWLSLIGADQPPVAGHFVDPNYELSDEIGLYINDIPIVGESQIEIGKYISIQYSGFSAQEMERNRLRISQLEDHRFSHKLFDKNYLGMTNNNQITMISRENVDYKTKDEYTLMKGILYSISVVVEIGRKSDVATLKRIESGWYHQKDIFGKYHCSMALSHMRNSRGQLNFMIVHSSAAAGSEEQLECLRLSTLVFIRPANVPFR